MESPVMLNLIVQSGSFGLLAYLIILGIPNLVKDMRAMMESFRQEYEAEREDRARRDALTQGMDTSRYSNLLQGFREELKNEREHCDKRIHELIVEIREFRRVAEIETRDLKVDIRDTRHAVKNLANAMGLKKAVDEMEAKGTK